MVDRPVVVEIPASSAYLVLIRSATNAVCARLDYPLDRLEDVALAASEAAGLLLRDTEAGARVRVELTPWREGDEVGVRIAVSTDTVSGQAPRPTSFSWTVLAALVNKVSASVHGYRVTMHLDSREKSVVR